MKNDSLLLLMGIALMFVMNAEPQTPFRQCQSAMSQSDDVVTVKLITQEKEIRLADGWLDDNEVTTMETAEGFSVIAKGVFSINGAECSYPILCKKGTGKITVELFEDGSMLMGALMK